MKLDALNPLVSKARRPRFEVHLKIYDLNNVPLVHGASHIKWHLPHSISSEHRGRTPKCPIAHHRVEYAYNKLIPVRIAIDKTNALSECLIEFEIIQEFSVPSSHHAAAAAAVVTNAATTKDERITLGRLTLNLAEYVEESEAIMRDTHGFRGSAAHRTNTQTTITPQSHQQQQQQQQPHDRKNSDASHTSLDSPAPITTTSDPLVEEGIIRRYLLTDAKINSTLKISLLVHQLDGERAYTAPPLKTAGAVFGGGILGGRGATRNAAEDFGQHFQDAHPEHDSANLSAAFNNSEEHQHQQAATAATASNPDAAAALHEVQDVYRRALAASWACQPGELPADECIEDIFCGGDGFGLDGDGEGGGGGGGSGGDVTPRVPGTPGTPGRKGPGGGLGMFRREDSGSSSTGEANDFLRPGGAATALKRGEGGGRRRSHVRQGSVESVIALRHGNDGRPGSAGGASVMSSSGPQHRLGGHRREGSKDSSFRGGRGGGGGGGELGAGMRRQDSLASLTGSGRESERSRSGFKSAREVSEREVREDYVAWALPGTA